MTIEIPCRADMIAAITTARCDLAYSTFVSTRTESIVNPCGIDLSSDPRRRCFLVINSARDTRRGNRLRVDAPTCSAAPTRLAFPHLLADNRDGKKSSCTGKRNYDECLTDGSPAKLNP